MSIVGDDEAQTISAAGYKPKTPANKEEPPNTVQKTRKRGVAHVQPMSTTEICIGLLDLRNEVAAMRKEQREERASRRQQLDRNEAMFKDLVDAYVGMTTTVKELKAEVTDKLKNEVVDIKKKLDTIAHRYEITKRTKPTADQRSISTTRERSKGAVQRTGRSTDEQEKKPLNLSTPLPWNRVAGARTTVTRVGRKNDPIIINEEAIKPEDVATPMVEVEIDQQDKKALWEPRPPQTVEVTAVTLDRVKPRNLFPAKEWRKLLKKHGIHPIAIWFPWRTSVEILIRTGELTTMHSLAKAMGREAQVLDPAKRKDGQALPLTQAALMTSINIRLRDLESPGG
ncbi:hypothetical protein GNI_189980 [Gregarina niphandrodes]|uniref:Uncharacterized protein n=1 Tax=Gregarina niphandrodes TaxID=110365 RepID=A0A023AXB5_GRENI|nr:hypothetical protein GNI_189980 [Gregarina niphandrodes]EZG43078.1 hypothetical protein GNI_189980 [Gregarina niphandrodes]|eukprot:XP_011133649.1 hypothetical protein GNI_189980 [Gregarina niphandrodes]